MGVRRGELFGLRWNDVDLDAGVAAVTQSLEQTNAGLAFKSPKTAKGRRRVELLPLTVEALREHRTRQDADRSLFGKDYADHGLVFALRMAGRGRRIRSHPSSRSFARRSA